MKKRHRSNKTVITTKILTKKTNLYSIVCIHTSSDSRLRSASPKSITICLMLKEMRRTSSERTAAKRRNPKYWSSVRLRPRRSSQSSNNNHKMMITEAFRSAKSRIYSRVRRLLRVNLIRRRQMLIWIDRRQESARSDWWSSFKSWMRMRTGRPSDETRWHSSMTLQLRLMEILTRSSILTLSSLRLSLRKLNKLDTNHRPSNFRNKSASPTQITWSTSMHTSKHLCSVSFRWLGRKLQRTQQLVIAPEKQS